jgi:prephenate dehydratase
MKVAYQGEPGAYSERAVRSLFPDAEPLPCDTVRHAFSRVTSGEATFGVVPLENSQAGSVNETYELLSNTSLLRIVGESIVRVDHALLGVPGARLEDGRSRRRAIPRRRRSRASRSPRPPAWRSWPSGSRATRRTSRSSR